MSDASISPDTDQETIDADAQEPLWQRLLYMLGFWFLGNIAFSLSILLGGAQLVVAFLGGNRNEELAKFSRRLVAYVYECLSFITFDRDDKPFPFGSFPESRTSDKE